MSEQQLKLIYYNIQAAEFEFASLRQLQPANLATRTAYKRPRFCENTYVSRRNVSFRPILPALSSTQAFPRRRGREAACDPGPREMSGDVSIDAILTVERSFDAAIRRTMLIPGSGPGS